MWSDVALPEHVPREGHYRIGILRRGLCFEPLPFVVPFAEETGLDGLCESERIAQRMFNDIKRDLSIGGRLHVGDDGVLQLPANRIGRCPFERPPLNDGRTTIGSCHQHRVLAELQQHEIDRLLAIRGLVKQSGRLIAAPLLLLAVGIVEFRAGQKIDQVDRGQMIGKPIGQQICGTVRAGPVSAAVMTLRKIDAGRSVGVAVNEDELATAVAVVMSSFAMLPHRDTQSTADPASIGIEFSRAIKQLVSEIEQRQVSGSAAVMSVIADEAEVG